MVKGKKIFWLILAGVICLAQLNAQESKNPFSDKKIEIKKVFDSIRDSNTSEIKVIQEHENQQDEAIPQQEEEENNEITITVRSGDTLSNIAQQYLGSADNWRQIVEWNCERYPSLLKNPDLIYPGWELQLSPPSNETATEEPQQEVAGDAPQMPNQTPDIDDDEQIAETPTEEADPETLTQTPDSQEFPDRQQSGSGEGGSAFAQRIANMSLASREREILQAIRSGNMPGFLEDLCNVTVRKRLSDGQTHEITYQVMPDYLAIGNDNDFVRMPMTPATAQAIADHFNMMLPTTEMVDQIYENAETRIAPRPMSGGQYPDWQTGMTTVEYFAEHNRLVERQTSGSGHQNGQLLAGHKKDIVISNRLNSNPNKVAIYGWHNSNNGGNPIQNLTTVHGENYVDYSHGVRLVSKSVVVDGRQMSIEDVLNDSTLSGLISNEGTISNTSATR